MTEGLLNLLRDRMTEGLLNLLRQNCLGHLARHNLLVVALRRLARVDRVAGTAALGDEMRRIFPPHDVECTTSCRLELRHALVTILLDLDDLLLRQIVMHDRSNLPHLLAHLLQCMSS